MHPLTKLVVRRIELGLISLLAVSAVTFLGVEMLPGDTVQAILGQSAKPEALANLRVSSGLGFFAQLKAVALPVNVLVMVVLAHMMRMTRAAILNVMQSDCIETAELKGLSPMQVIWRHSLPNAVAPIISVVVINRAYLVVGMVVVEVVFSYNALGHYQVEHVAKRDLPMVQAVGINFAAVYIGLNIPAEPVGIISNPRLRHPK